MSTAEFQALAEVQARGMQPLPPSGWRNDHPDPRPAQHRRFERRAAVAHALFGEVNSYRTDLLALAFDQITEEAA